MLRNNYFGETKTHYKSYKCGKTWAVMGISVCSLALGMLVTSQPVSADVAATSTSSSSSAVKADSTGASSSSATKADSTSASSSAVKADSTGASSSSATKADSTSASSSAVKADSTGASSSSATKADSTSASSSSAVKTETTSASSSSATKADSTGASSSSAVKTETTGKILKTDLISGTTGSKSSYSTSGSIAYYKKRGYDLVSDGYPADFTFDHDDTTDQHFTVHLKHHLTPVNPTNSQTPGALINPDEPDGPKWPTSTNYDKTVNETVSYVDQNGHVVAKQHTDSVNFTRTVVVDNVTGEVITSGAGTTAWTATNGDTTFDAVVSPVVPGSVADKAQTAAVTDLNADSADVNETVTYTKVGSLVPSSSDGNFPGAPTVVYPNDPSDATKVTPAGVPTVPGYTAHNPEGNVLTPGSSYQPSDPTKDTTITYTADNPSQPTTPAKPVNPSQPTTPAKPVNPSQLTTPAKPVNPSQPTTPAKPVNPSQLTTLAKPVNPSQPTTPAKPVNPSQPTTPAKPVNPSQPTTPAKPVNPSQPTTPAKPVQAGQAAATNFVDQRLPQTGETDQQHMTLSGLLLLATSSVLGLFGMTKRQRKE